MESTRYCNYSSNKFNNEITCIIPPWLNLEEKQYTDSVDINGIEGIFINSLLDSEAYYFDLMSEGWKPQHARQVLPNALKTDIMMCGFKDDYDHFFELRTSEAAHPSIREVALMMKDLIYPIKNIND